MGVTDRRALARWQLETELFGPSVSLGKEELAARCEGLSPSEAQELGEYLARPLSDRHRRFRTMSDRLSMVYGEVRRAFDEVDHHPSEFRDGRDLVSWYRVERADQRWLKDHDLGASNVPSLPAAVSRLVVAVNRTVRRDFPALDELSWIRDWLLRVARQADEYARRGGDPKDWSITGNGLMMSELPIVLYQPEIRLEDTRRIGFGLVTVDRSPSKEVARERLQMAVRASMEALQDRAVSTTETDAPAIDALIEDVLRVEYPPARRAYSVDPQAQVRRDVSLWGRVRLDREKPTDIARNAWLRVEPDPLFRVRESGSRSRVPTTKRGVNDAVARATKLLR